MGATGWSYFVPYQKNINKALQVLRRQVFTEGQYQGPYKPTGEELETAKLVLKTANSLLAARSPDPETTRKQLDVLLAFSGVLERPRRTRPAPKTIKGLLKRCGENGTHSILDIDRVSPTPALGAVTPLSQQQLLSIFGTEQPARSLVETWSAQIDPPDAEPLYGRWEGIYLIVYQDSQPHEIYFEGCSGD